MAIQSVQEAVPFLKADIEGIKANKVPFKAQQNFAAFLKDSINEVNRTEANSVNLTNKLIRGENVDLHQVLIASQKANITMQLTMEVRNKAVEAYQEIMRMQM